MRWLRTPLALSRPPPPPPPTPPPPHPPPPPPCPTRRRDAALPQELLLYASRLFHHHYRSPHHRTLHIAPSCPSTAALCNNGCNMATSSNPSTDVDIDALLKSLPACRRCRDCRRGCDTLV